MLHMNPKVTDEDRIMELQETYGMTRLEAEVMQADMHMSVSEIARMKGISEKDVMGIIYSASRKLENNTEQAIRDGYIWVD